LLEPAGEGFSLAATISPMFPRIGPKSLVMTGGWTTLSRTIRADEARARSTAASITASLTAEKSMGARMVFMASV